MVKRICSIAKDFALKMQKKNIDTCAGSTSFFIMLSIIPLLILLTSCLPYTAATEGDLVHAINDITPPFAQGIMVRLVTEAYSKSGSIMPITILFSLWSGAVGMLSIIRGLNSIYEVDEKRPVMFLRVIAVLYTLAMIAIVLLMLLMMVFGNVINSFLSRTWPSLSQGLEHMADFKFIIIIGGATILFAVIYTYIPSIKLSYFKQLPGALFSAVVWYIFSMIFAIHVNRTTRYSSLYGNLATPIVMMLWVYFCIYIFFIGAHINHYLLLKSEDEEESQ
ncbi:YihY/virulence factor BrkB family protein [Butyrivibrio proteoclasticus]|uniref:YihY/virulence factor BrkB family protein n=1 Tax=Butyrivibrio proteoclasticus TaxID=43305 RepID=UPI0006885527|nr:YihY/virulence factor BrkB family protein [Butyrivibrio proteoclasticus]